MFKNVRTAVRRQRRIIVIFFLTIFLPSLVLGIFGIRAIRSERFLLARQIENECRRASGILKSDIETQLAGLDSFLLEFSRSDAFLKGDRTAVRKSLESSLADEPLCTNIFLFSENQEAWFPLFQPLPNTGSPWLEGIPNSLSVKLKSAERLEFETAGYDKAAAIYREIFDRSRNRHFQGQMLANVARCLLKQKRYDKALENYLKVSKDYGELLSSSGMPLALGSRLQTAVCRMELGDLEGALQDSLSLFKDIVEMRWAATEAQFKTYASLAQQTVADTLSRIQPESLSESQLDEWNTTRSRHQFRLQQWEDMRNIRQYVLPELINKKHAEEPSEASLRYCHSIGGKPFLITAIPVRNPFSGSSGGLLGAEVGIAPLMQKVVAPVLRETPIGEDGALFIADLNGVAVFGEKPGPDTKPVFSSFFEGNFPPWTIQFFPRSDTASETFRLRKNFYLWSILTLVVVLIFGAVVISRSIAQETAFLNLKSDFVSAVSHEFKSPLTSIKSLSGRLRAGTVRDEARRKQYFEVIEQDADRLMGLVGNILDFSKMEEGKREFEFVPTDLRKLIEDELEIFQRLEISGGPKIRADLDADIPEIPADREALSRAIKNLLDNAVKFSPENTEIRVSLSMAGDFVHIAVADRGIGIPRHELERIFEKFYQGRGSSRSSARGTGLGLTLVKHTAEAHGGRVSVESRLGEGSTFTIALPVTGRKR